MRTQTGNQKGFSLVELMLAMALGLIVVTGIVQLFIGNSRSANVISGQARLQENARFAFEFISSAARRAGYYGCIRDEQTRVWGLVGNPAQLPEYNVDRSVGGFEGNGDGTWTPSAINLPGGTPGNTNQGGVIDGAALEDGTDIMVFRNLRQPTQRLVQTTQPLDEPVITAPNGNPGFGQDDIVMIADCEQSAVFRVTNINIAANEATLSHAPNFGGASPFFQNSAQVTPPAGPQVDFTKSFLGRSYGTDSVVGEIESTFFFIAESTRPNNAGDMPLSLWQKRGPDGPVELIQGVEDMQVLYGVDTTLTDGVSNPNRYVTADAIPDTRQVVAIRVSLAVNSIDRVTENNATLTRTFSKTILVRNANPEL
jgi:type IV pilus assembly protein PilW